MITLFVAFDEFLQDSEADGLTVRTLDWYRVQLKGFIDAHQGTPLDHFTHNLLRGYVLTIRRSAKSEYTARAKINALHRFWSWASGRFNMPNPMDGIRRPKMPEPQPKAISADDLKMLFKATYFSRSRSASRDRALLIFMADTGVRSAGVLGLTLADLDIEKRRAIVREKGNRARSIPFTELTANLLRQWLVKRPIEGTHVFCTGKGKRLTHAGLRMIFRRLATKAGVSGRANPHSLRHFAAREYLSNGGDLATAARLLGHRNVTTTARYYAVYDDDEVADRHDEHSPLKSVFKREGKGII